MVDQKSFSTRKETVKVIKLTLVFWCRSRREALNTRVVVCFIVFVYFSIVFSGDVISFYYSVFFRGAFCFFVMLARYGVG